MEEDFEYIREDFDKLFGENPKEADIKANKYLRLVFDTELQFLKELPKSRERSLAITKLQECIMWLGMDLKRINDGKSPYVNSYNPSNTKIEPTSGGLKL